MTTKNQYDEGSAVKVVILRDEDADGKWHAEETPAASGGGLTDAQLRASPVPVTGGGGGTEYIEGIASPADPAAGARNYRARTALATEVSTDGMWVTANATVKGELYVKHVDTITVDTELPAAAALGDTDGNPTTPTVGAALMVRNGASWTRALGANTADAQVGGGLPSAALWGFNGATWDRLRSSTTNGLVVDVSRVQGSVAVTGTFWQATQPVSLAAAVDVSDRAARLVGVVDTELPAAAALADATANPTVPGVGSFGLVWNGTTWDREPRTAIDHDAVNTLPTVQVGGNASPSDVPPTLVSANGDRTRNWVDRAGAQIMRRRKLRETFSANYRLAEAAATLKLSFVHVANTNKQYLTLHHAATAVKEVRVQKVLLYLWTSTVATEGIFELRRITATPATGNPAITPIARNSAAAATECIALALPTTAGTDATPNSPITSVGFNKAIVAATTAPGSDAPFVLFDSSLEDDEALPIIFRIGVLEGIALTARTVAATTIGFTAQVVYTEEVV